MLFYIDYLDQITSGNYPFQTLELRFRYDLLVFGRDTLCMSVPACIKLEQTALLLMKLDEFWKSGKILLQLDRKHRGRAENYFANRKKVLAKGMPEEKLVKHFEFVAYESNRTRTFFGVYMPEVVSVSPNVLYINKLHDTDALFRSETQNQFLSHTNEICSDLEVTRAINFVGMANTIQSFALDRSTLFQRALIEDKIVDQYNPNSNEKNIIATLLDRAFEALEKQMQWYEDQTKYHPNWTVVGKYIDEGITGTLAKKRPSFMKMIEDAKQRKFDLIVTREVCRFARNTVDTLVLTRELKNYGVEVYFVSDNIWTMDGDGELRLTIMATLAQEESRKISERVRAGQAVSRENGVLFGNGNIIGYDRVGSTYVINPEQAATIRTIFELYSQGLGQMKIVNELTRRGCKDGNGNVKWSCIKISRILRNATYMGYLCYNKSKVNNFLEKRRIKNLDEDSFILKKGDFEPIISEALWHQCENIRNGRIRKYQMPSGEERRRGTRIAQNLWVKKLRCRCGAGYNRFKWRVLRDGTPVYGYQCNYRTQNPAKTFVEKNHLDSQKYCDAIVICEWKLDLMAKMIFDQLWGDQREAVLKACQMIESCILSTTLQTDSEKAEKQKKIEKLEQRLLNLGQMRADGELTREQFQKLYAQTTTELDALKTQQNSVPDSAEEEVSFDLNKIKKGLSQMVDITAPRISEELINEFVEAVTPVENHHYRWKMTFGEMKSGQERYNLMEPENSPVLSFTIDFETARQYRMSNGLPAQFRQRGWTDLNVEVYL